jgi:hypothetical protein
MKQRAKWISLVAIVVALIAFGCSGGAPSTVATLNATASVTGQLPANPLEWMVIASFADRASSTMSTLYGNDPAVHFVRTHSGHDYPRGSVIALVTWTTQEDPRWFGARIPQQAKSVEFVTVAAPANGHASYSYEKFEGAPLKESPQDPVSAKERVEFLISQRAAVWP